MPKRIISVEYWRPPVDSWVVVEREDGRIVRWWKGSYEDVWRKYHQWTAPPKRIRRIVVYYGNRPIGHSKTERGKAEKYCPVNVIVGTINPKYTEDELIDIAEELKFQIEGDRVMGGQTLFRVGVESREIDEDEYLEMKEFLDKYNDRARKCFDDETFVCSEHIWTELLMCGVGIIDNLIREGVIKRPAEPLSEELKTEDICEECLPDFHSLYILKDKDIYERCKLFKVGGFRASTMLEPIP